MVQSLIVIDFHLRPLDKDRSLVFDSRQLRGIDSLIRINWLLIEKIGMLLSEMNKISLMFEEIIGVLGDFGSILMQTGQ